MFEERAVETPQCRGLGAPSRGPARPPSTEGRSGLAAARVLKVALDIYRRYVSPAIGCHCRFHPTCSRYALLAIDLHGPWRGSLLAVKRVLRCHPLHPGGVDPVPDP